MIKPNVFSTSNSGDEEEKKPLSMTDAMREANDTGTKIAEQANKELDIEPFKKSEKEHYYENKMKEDTLNKLEEQLRIREEFLKRRKAENSGEIFEEVESTVKYAEIDSSAHKTIEVSDEEMFSKLSQPQFNAPYDVIKIPSEGFLYKNHSGSLKIAYLNASDENIITNPNLLRSGKFLEVLINRKLLDSTLRYKDLHVGDRNAIMIWLRSTGFGPNYNITVHNPHDEFKEFNVEIDLSKLPIKNLKVKPDENGHFTFKLPISGNILTFKLLTIRDVDSIDSHIEKITEELGPEFSDGATFTLKKHILAVDGDFNRVVVDNFIDKGMMRLGDVRAFRNFINEIESGIDMNLSVRTPGGESVNTFLPLNTSFFWPDLEV